MWKNNYSVFSFVIILLLTTFLKARVVTIETGISDVVGSLKLFDRKESTDFFATTTSIYTPIIDVLFSSKIGQVSAKIREKDQKLFAILHEKYMPIQVSIQNKSDHIIYLKKNSYLSPFSQLQNSSDELPDLYRRFYATLSDQRLNLLTFCLFMSIVLASTYHEVFTLNNPVRARCPYTDPYTKETSIKRKLWYGVFGIIMLKCVFLAQKIYVASSIADVLKKLKKNYALIINKKDAITHKSDDFSYHTVYPGWIFTETIYIDLSKVPRSQCYTFTPQLHCTTSESQ